MTLKLTNKLNESLTFRELKIGTVFEYKEAIHIKVNNRTALKYMTCPTFNFWLDLDCFTGDEEITIIESELILKSRRG
jgi:hypothetical protein